MGQMSIYDLLIDTWLWGYESQIEGSDQLLPIEHCQMFEPMSRDQRGQLHLMGVNFYEIFTAKG